jgi:putative MATE family efflux protein
VSAGTDVPVSGQDAPVRRLRSPHDRAIALLALPALGALIADPLLSLVDTAFVGRLGSEELAALGVASAVFGVAFFVFNFLEYGTTSEVARAIGRGETAAAGRATVTALSIATVAGAAVTVALLLATGMIMGAFGATPDVAGPGATYVMIRALSAPAVLVVRASHGAFRGFQDTRTPMIVALAANGLNLLLDPLLIFGFGWGIAGAAWATVVAQWGAAAWFLVLFIRNADRFGLRGARPVPGELRRFLAVGRDLAIRTAALMATFTLATAIATRVSSEAVAAHQVLAGLFLFAALALDALAIAAQALVGRAVGAGDGAGAFALADRLLVLGVGVGLALMAILMGHRRLDPELVHHRRGGSLRHQVVVLDPRRHAAAGRGRLHLGRRVHRARRLPVPRSGDARRRRVGDRVPAPGAPDAMGTAGRLGWDHAVPRG